jgi:hypothetical protein
VALRCLLPCSGQLEVPVDGKECFPGRVRTIFFVVITVIIGVAVVVMSITHPHICT